MKIGITCEDYLKDIEAVYPEEDILVLDERTSDRDIHTLGLVIFPGGEDISPAIYNEHITHSIGINYARDIREVTLFRKLYSKKHITLFGYCRGHQLINAILGGKLVQDIRIETGDNHSAWHDLEFVYPEVYGKFWARLSDLFYGGVNSLHHQGVKSPGKLLNIVAFHKNIVEITLSNDERIFSVQCHPEWFGLHKDENLIQIQKEFFYLLYNKAEENFTKERK